jgi:micrococcal nuclease
MSSKILKFLSLISILCLIGCQQINIEGIRVIEVIDGDTVILSDGRTLRYIGIDAPEVRRHIGGDFVYDPQPFGLEAKEFNQNLVEGKEIKLEFDVQKKDKYGRLLAYCFVDDTFVNAKLLEEGFALLYTRPPNVKYVDLFVSLQKRAREEKKGIWAKDSVISSDEAHKYIGKVKSVEGRVLNIYTGEKAIHLNFGKDWRKDFTIVIFKKDLPNFTAKGIHPLKDYQNRFIRVTGPIKEYNGPEIIVSHPSLIEVIE